MSNLRKAGWPAIRKARNQIQDLRMEALHSADRAVKAGERQQAEWWKGRADGLLSADTLLLIAMVEAKDYHRG